MLIEILAGTMLGIVVNELFLQTRKKCIEIARREIALCYLPPYNEMVFHPKHWGKWTINQWTKYAKK